MLPDLAQEIEIANRVRPVGIIEQARWVGRAFKIEPSLQLLLFAGDVRRQYLPGEQLALGALAAGIANRAGRAARQRDGMMAEKLEAPQGQQRHQVADVKTLG